MESRVPAALPQQQNQHQQQKALQPQQQQQQQFLCPAVDIRECQAFRHWYGHYQHHFYHQHLAAMAAAAAAQAAAVAAADFFYGPSRAKRRKVSVDDGKAPSTNTSRLLRSRGRVTFKPYTDDLEEGDEDGTLDAGGGQCSGQSRRRSGAESCELSPRSPGEVEASGSGMRRTCAKGDSGARMRIEAGMSLALRRRTAAAGKAARKTTMNDLLPEVLTHIFDFMDVKGKGTAAMVCRQWRDSAYRKYLWTDVVVRLHLDRPNPFLYPSLVRRGVKHVQVLSIKRLISLKVLLHGMPQLESLNLSGCYNLNDLAIESAFNGQTLSAMKRVNLSLCKDVGDATLGRISNSCPELEELDMSGCTRVSTSGAFYTAIWMKKLKRLNLRSCRLVSDFSIEHLAGQSRNTRDTHFRERVSPIEELCLQDCQKITDESLKYIAAGMPNLKSINLSFCVSITDTGVKYLSKLKGLETLNLRSCDNVSDLGMGFLCDTNGPSKLKSLDVSFCAGVSDSGLKVIAAGLPNLRSLWLTTCAVGDDGLKKVAEKLMELRDLSVGQCAGVTDEGLAALAKGLKHLNSLDVYGCPGVTAAALDKMRRDMPMMRSLKADL